MLCSHSGQRSPKNHPVGQRHHYTILCGCIKSQVHKVPCLNS
jgi:hypothetical protein